MTGNVPKSSQPSTRLWQWTIVVAMTLLLTLSSFAAGILAERQLFSHYDGASTSRDAGALRNDSASDEMARFTRLHEIERLVEEEYYYVPASEVARSAFGAKLERDARAGLVASLRETASPTAGTPVPGPATAGTPIAAESLDDYLRRLEYAAIQGMMGGLEDDYTAFLEPVEQAPLAEHLSGQYEGIGVWVNYPEGRFTIVAPIPGSPAEKAGLRSGDIVESANGHPLEGISEDDALAIIRGPVGTSVRLTIVRGGFPGSFDINVMRAKIEVPSVVYTFRPDDRVAVIQVSVFGDKTTDEVDDALSRAKKDRASGLVLDLRNNGGGWVTGAQEMIGRFVPASKGAALYEDETLSEDDDPASQPIMGGQVNLFDTPMVVLVNGGTASASEIVAGALRDYGRAQIAGESTFGKGSVQRIHDFEDGSSLRITIARWLTPSKQPIPKEGLQPDLVITATPGDSTHPDPQLDRAVHALSEPRP
jgi:carboxyl-terminal processing protease